MPSKTKRILNRKPTKGGTSSSKKHTFQSFTQKVAAIKIDPIRRVRRHIEDEEATAGTASFFHTSLVEWVDLNLSATFTEFVRQVKPWSESLPHVLHHQDKIMDALVKNIDEGDDVGMEPLLSLLSQFARDLGVEFEKHFQTAVELLLRVVAKRTAVEVIEYAFNSLAYLLKYLSRLLVPDLRPLFDILSPLLGKTVQKHHLTRFAAEAFSFLFRKAREGPLKLIVHHICTDLVRSSEQGAVDQYLHGLSVLFTEACMGVDHHLHSRGPSILMALLEEAIEAGPDNLESTREALRPLLTNVIVGLTHRMNQETYGVLLEVIFEFVDKLLLSSKEDELSMIAAILHCCTGTRKGNRIQNWAQIMERIEQLLSKCQGEETMWEASLLAAVALQTADLPSVVGRYSRIVQSVRNFNDGALFLPFCHFFASLGGERFGQFLLSDFQRFDCWASYEDALCVIYPKFHAEGLLKTTLSMSAAERCIADAFTKYIANSESEEEALKCHQYLEVLGVFVSLGATLSAQLELILKDCIVSAIHSKLECSKVALLSGKILSLVGEDSEIVDAQLAKDIVAKFDILGDNYIFLRGVNNALSKFQPVLTEETIENLLAKLERNLSSPRHETRASSLDLISRLVPSESETFSLMKLIEDTPLSLTTSRTICMHIRKLGVVCSSVGCEPRIAKMVPHFCFGLLTIRFAALWDDTMVTLKSLSAKQEELVASNAISWLEAKFSETPSEDKHEAPDLKGHLTEFECSNLSLLVNKADQAFDACFNTKDILEESFAAKEQQISPSFARTQSLKFLCEVPHIAERRSRTIVPIFLDWYHAEDLEDDDDVSSLKRTRNDKIAILTLFSKFNNPKSLYKSEIVFSTLLNCLTSGDSKTQGLALKAIYSWKLPGVRPYEENLNNLVDEDKFREEITNFIQVRAEESKIQDDHRAQLMPVLLRVLYGRSLARKNSSSGARGMESRRTVVLAALTNFPTSDLDTFIDIAMGPLSTVNVFDKSVVPYSVRMESEVVSSRKQLGFVNMMEDLFKQMGTTLLPFAGKLMDAIFYCLLASRNTSDQNRATRQVGFRCLNALFSSCSVYEWGPYMPTFFSELINPRIDALPTETSQSVSGVLQLLSTWASSARTAGFLYEYNGQVLPRVGQCLAAEAVKESVVMFILEFIHKLVEVSEGEPLQHLFKPHVDLLIVRVGDVLQKSPSKEVLDKGVSAVARLSPYASGVSETKHLIELCLFLLGQPSRRVNPKSKSDILRIVSNILPHYISEMDDFEKAYKTITSLFGFFHDKESRELLSKIMSIFARKDETLSEVASLCDDLNSYSKRSFGEPDFDRRLKAFSKINEERFEHFTAHQWIPLANNMLFFIRDQEELVIRTSASYSLRRLVEGCAKIREQRFIDIISKIVYPAVLRGSREASELIRMEYVSVMAHIVQHCSFWPDVADMQSLLVDGDGEANFFLNILHIQQHRRIRALKRLAATAQKERLSCTNITQFFIPLTEHFIFDQDEGAHNLATDAINTIGVLSEQLEWNQFRALFKRYIGFIKEKPDREKIVIRVIGAVTDALYRASVKEVVTVVTNGTENTKDADVEMDGEEEQANDGDVNGVDIEMDGEEDGSGGEKDEDVKMANGSTVTVSYLSTVLPPKVKLSEDITAGFLPILVNYLHHKDEAMVSLRMPLAISIVKILHVLPDDEMKLRLSGVLMDICHVLRSRDQGSRDTTRKTLTEIATLLGPKYFGFILKELKSALLRGYQLHVLSYTVHTLLLSVVPQFKIGALNYCASMIADIVMEDIFGVIGSEKEAEGYTNKMKEIKSSKSYDSMELIASITTAQYLQDLIKPIKGILGEKLNLKIVKKVDDLFRRITVGIMRNESLKSQELLIFCWQVVEDTYKSQEKMSTKTVKPKTFAQQNRERFIVDLRIHKHKQTTSQLNLYSFKFVRFALDLLRSVLQKNDFLMTPENLDGFMPVIGDAILSDEEEVQISAIRLLSAIIRVDLPSIKTGAGVFIGQCMTFIRSCSSTNAELAQASLKLLSSILREKKLNDVKIKDASLAYLLDRVAPDLEEPDRQGVTFNFIKAVLSRKIVIDGVYDIMDEISRIMVTNQARTVRDSCRGIYFQFVTDYPQGSVKLKKQLHFLAANLDYEHEAGRKSVMEAVHLFLTKIALPEVCQYFFVPLVMSLVNDESAECREMAAALLQKCLEKADRETLQSFLSLMKTWLTQTENPMLTRVAVQLYGTYFETYKTETKGDVALVLQEMLSIIEEGTASMDSTEDISWEIIYFSLQTWTKIVKHVLDDGISQKYAEMWAAVRRCMGYHHAWIRLVASRLMGMFFGDFKGDLKDLPLKSEHGAEITKDEMLSVAKASFSQLRIAELSDELGHQAVRNLVFLSRCFYANGMKADDSDGETDDDNEEADDEDGGEADGDDELAIHWLIKRTAGIVRYENPRQRSVTGKKSSMQLLASIMQVMSGEDLVSVAAKIIMPLYNLTESESEHLKDLKPLAQEILQMLSSRMGTTAYTEAYASVRNEVQTRRRERKYKRSIQLVSDPERAARRKMRKHERGKESKKARHSAFRDARRARYL